MVGGGGWWWWVVVVCKPILVFSLSLGQAEQFGLRLELGLVGLVGMGGGSIP